MFSKTLVQTLSVSHAAVAKTVARLERAGLVERRSSTKERRIGLVFLTPAGRALHDQIIAIWRGLEELATAGLEPDERRAYLGAAAKIQRSMEDGEAMSRALRV